MPMFELESFDELNLPIPNSTIEILEGSFFKVPLEEAKKIARQTQRVLEKEWKPLKDDQKLPAILKKINDLRDEELRQIELLGRRQEFMQQVLEKKEEGVKIYLQTKYKRVLIEHLARTNHFPLAYHLAAEFNLQVTFKYYQLGFSEH